MNALSGVDSLTPRERQVLDLLAQGRTNGEIADALSISFDTVKWHVSEILSKLPAESREEAAERCYVDGVLLRDLGDTTEADGVTWLKVATPDGREGWASAEFLER
jgi:NarL family two-component system response regulator LiaR